MTGFTPSWIDTILSHKRIGDKPAMSIPAFQAMMLPLLQLTADGAVHRLADLRPAIIAHFDLTDEEAGQLLPSGGQTVVANRIGWAATHFRKAGVFETAGSGLVRITQRGRDLMKENLARIDMRVLDRFPEHVQFHSGKQADVSAAATPMPVPSSETPEEALIRNYREINEGLRDDLLVRIKAMSPTFFERLVLDLMLKLGYGGELGSGETLGRAGDGGVDGVIREDKLGLDVIYLQAKRWEGTVGRPTVQAFAGSLAGHHATKGVLITTSAFSQDAHQYVHSLSMRIVLIDGATLADL
ncbi:MAG: restriction endonuclease [Dehalococcoidia bacterium]